MRSQLQGGINNSIHVPYFSSHIGAKCEVPLNAGIHFNVCMPKTAATNISFTASHLHICNEIN